MERVQVSNGDCDLGGERARGSCHHRRNPGTCTVYRVGCSGRPHHCTKDICESRHISRGCSVSYIWTVCFFLRTWEAGCLSWSFPPISLPFATICCCCFCCCQLHAQYSASSSFRIYFQITVVYNCYSYIMQQITETFGSTLPPPHLLKICYTIACYYVAK